MNALKRWTSKDSTKSTASTAGSNGADDGDDALEAILDEEPSGSTSTAGVSISSSRSSNRVTLKLARQDLTITGGTTLEGTLSVPADLMRDAKLITLTFLGTIGMTIMGSQRYQAASAISVLGGGVSAASAVPITFRETHAIVEVPLVLWQQAQGEGGSSGKGAFSGSSATFSFSLDVPRTKQCTCPAASWNLPPTADLRHPAPGQEAIMDRSAAEIAYCLKVKVERNGRLKRNTRMKVPLKLIDDSPPDYAMQEVQTTTVRQALKYASEAGDMPPLLEAQLAFHPPTSRGATIHYTLSWRLVMAEADPDVLPQYEAEEGDTNFSSDPPTASAAEPPRPGVIYKPIDTPLAAQVQPRIEVSLSRRTWTTPVERPKSGQACAFAAYTLVLGKTAPASAEGETSSGGSFSGTIAVPPEEVSAFSCGAEIKHAIHARVLSQSLKGPMFLKKDIFLPSG